MIREANWEALSESRRRDLLARPARRVGEDIRARVVEIIDAVAARGDRALLELTAQYDGVTLASPVAGPEVIEAQAAKVAAPLAGALQALIARVRTYHLQTGPQEFELQIGPGLSAGRMVRPIDSVGLYVPGGSAPLVSSAVMQLVPARLAGCRQITLACPPTADGLPDPAIAWVCRALELDQIVLAGGAQAVAAMGLGTESVPACAKLFGPGNPWVTEAKLQLQGRGLAVDMPAGPSEVLVIADQGATPSWVAADLLSQAEHGPDSQVLLVSDSASLIDAVARALDDQLQTLPRQSIAAASLKAAIAIHTASLEVALEVSNRYGPEHLILAVREPRALLPQVRNAGSVFLGDFASESLGDYGAGPNHVLPTGAAVRAWSGLSVAAFTRTVSVLEADYEGAASLAQEVAVLARQEGLEAHARAALVRVEA